MEKCGEQNEAKKYARILETNEKYYWLISPLVQWFGQCV